MDDIYYIYRKFIMLKRISTIDYYGTEFINLEGSRVVIDPGKFDKILDIIKTVTYFFGSSEYITIPQTTNSFIINLFIDEYQLEIYAERGTVKTNSVQNIYKDGVLVVEDIARRNYENKNYSFVFVEFSTKLNWLIRNLFSSSNISESLYHIKHNYDFNSFDILNEFVSYLFDNIDYIDLNGIHTKNGYRLDVSSQGSGFISYINLLPMMCAAIKTNSTVLLDRYTSFHPILKKAIFEELWDKKVLHKLMKEDDSKGQIIMRNY